MVEEHWILRGEVFHAGFKPRKVVMSRYQTMAEGLYLEIQTMVEGLYSVNVD